MFHAEVAAGRGGPEDVRLNSVRVREALTLTLFLACAPAFGQSETSFKIDARTQTYEITNRTLGWKLGGKVDGPIQDLQTSDSRSDQNGPYSYARFTWKSDGILVRAEIFCYKDRPAVRFRLHYLDTAWKPIVFPNLTSFPSGLKTFSYRDSTFAPASFSLNQTATPWLLFNDRAQAIIFSPASQFMIAKMVGDGRNSIGVSLNDRLQSVPKGLDQDSLLVFSQGIQRGWDDWGEALRNVYGRSLPKADQSPILKSFGYWTDNGADYYYNYEPDKGYAGTLKALVARYRDEGIPLGYLQLDSWWYQKSVDDPAGKPGGATKNSKLPAGSWNRYGGTMIYRAHPDLFPNGLAAFQKEIGLPLVTHARWIDRKSPYHDLFRFSGVGSIDPKWWSQIADYLEQAKVFCYEQDWLDRIYDNSPEMFTVAGIGDAFTDGMAWACRRNGMDMQYCMATPRFFLQGLKYPNLTTIRVTDDRFDRGKWAPFLYCSQLAQEIGARPWCDVFKSGETANMILATLSAGPVGTGDAIGKEDKANILKAARPDGVIVRPDRALTPCDPTYLDTAGPFLASTFTDQGNGRTRYVFAFSRTKEQTSMTVSPRDFGETGPSYLLDLQTGEGRFMEPNDGYPLTIGDSGFAYLTLLPISKSGIGLIGDMGKFVPTGRQRIPSIREAKGGLDVTVDFASNEQPITLEGVSLTPPSIHNARGNATLLRYDRTTKRFAIEVSANSGRAEFAITGHP